MPYSMSTLIVLPKKEREHSVSNLRNKASHFIAKQLHHYYLTPTITYIAKKLKAQVYSNKYLNNC